MPTVVNGPVVLPDGSTPEDGFIIFTPLTAIIAAKSVPPAPLPVPIGTGGAFTTPLEGVATGTKYNVQVQQTIPLVGVSLTDIGEIVVTGTGTGTLSSFITVPAPRRATSAYVLYQGETLALPIQWTDSLNRPIDISSVTITSWLVLDKIKSINLTVTKNNPTAGQFTTTATAAQTSGLAPGKYEWFVKLAAASGTKIKRGVISVLEVTQ